MNKSNQESIYILNLSESDKNFLIHKAKSYFEFAFGLVFIDLFFATLFGIYHFNVWIGVLGFFLLFISQHLKSLLKASTIGLALLNNKKVTGVGKITYKVTQHENQEYALDRIKMDKIISIYHDSNEGFSLRLEKMKVGHIGYFEITKFGNLILEMSHQVALNKDRKRQK